MIFFCFPLEPPISMPFYACISSEEEQRLPRAAVLESIERSGNDTSVIDQSHVTLEPIKKSLTGRIIRRPQ